MTRAEILNKFPEAVDYRLSDMPVIYTDEGYYAKFDGKLDFYFGKYTDLSVLKAEGEKYQILVNA